MVYRSPALYVDFYNLHASQNVAEHKASCSGIGV